MLSPLRSNTAPASARDALSRGLQAFGPGVKYRLMVATRAVLAIAGSYLLASLFATALALYLPKLFGSSPVDAVLTGTIYSFAVFACGVMWVFAARTILRAFVGLLLAAAPLGGVVLLALRSGGAA